MNGGIARIAPLVDQLQRFCHGHEQGEHGAAAATMLAYLRGVWPELPVVSVQPAPDDGRDTEELALGIISDVGELAAVLLSARDLERELAWSRANLVVDLERYAILVEGLP